MMATNVPSDGRLKYQWLHGTADPDGDFVDSNEHLYEKCPPSINTADSPAETFSLDSRLAPTEPKKSVLSSSIYILFTWHIGTAISIPATAFLLFLNLAECSISPRLGANHTLASNMVGALQLLAKFHELMIITSLVNITRQWIQRSLLDENGTLLGLVGAELSVMNAGYLISDGYWAAVKLAVFGRFGRAKGATKGWQRRRRGNILLLLAFLPVACLLCLLVGPASATLMIPRQSWFFKGVLDIMRYSQPVQTSNYPNIFIDPRLSRYDNYRVLDFMKYEYYWKSLWANSTASVDFFNEHEELTHTASYLGVLATNSTTSWGRPLTVDAEWNGKTRFRGIMLDYLNTYYAAWLAFGEKDPKALREYSEFQVQAATEMTGLEMDIVCRLRAKERCSDTTFVDDEEWCYVPAFTEPSMGGPLRSNRDLLLISDHRPFQYLWGHVYPNMTPYILPKLYLTEGPRLEADQRFTNSTMFVFEQYEGSNLFVCTTNATLKGATALIYDLTDLHHTIGAQYHEYISHFDNTTTTLEAPRPFLYHENWLDYLHTYNYDGKTGTPAGPGDLPGLEIPDYSTPRFARGETTNPKLKSWGDNIVESTTLFDAPIWLCDNDWARRLEPTSEFVPLAENPVLPPRDYVEAGIVEIVVGGSWFTMLLTTLPSATQYQSVNQSIPPAIMEIYPEPVRNYSSSFYKPISFYYFVYGYRLSSRTSIIAAFLLSFHAVIAIVGSIWQLRERCIIIAWGSIPEYVTLCVGSFPSTRGIKNTCAGIRDTETLQRRVRIGETVSQHLEIAVVGSGRDLDMIGVEKKKKYGGL